MPSAARPLLGICPPCGFIALAMHLTVVARHSGTVNSSLTLRAIARSCAKRKMMGMVVVSCPDRAKPRHCHRALLVAEEIDPTATGACCEGFRYARMVGLRSRWLASNVLVRSMRVKSHPTPTPSLACKNDPFDGAETGGAEPQIAEQPVLAGGEW
jgi:hypothetical protein